MVLNQSVMPAQAGIHPSLGGKLKTMDPGLHRGGGKEFPTLMFFAFSW